MRDFLQQPANLLSIWGLNIVSFLNNSLPYLQFISLVLAIALSIMSMKRMTKNNKGEEENNDPVI